MLEIPLSNFFDDFPMVCPEEDATEVSSCCSRLLHLLGWKFAEVGDKALPFSSSFDVLGMHICLDAIWERKISLANKVRRVDKILERLRVIRSQG